MIRKVIFFFFRIFEAFNKTTIYLLFLNLKTKKDFIICTSLIQNMSFKHLCNDKMYICIRYTYSIYRSLTPKDLKCDFFCILKNMSNKVALMEVFCNQASSLIYTYNSSLVLIYWLHILIIISMSKIIKSVN